MTDFPEKEVLVLTTGDVVLFPGSTFTLLVDQPAQLSAVRLAADTSGWMVAVARRTEGEGEPDVSDLAHVGVIGRIEALEPATEEIYQVVFRAQQRFQIAHFDVQGTSIHATGAALLDKTDADEATLTSLRTTLQDTAVDVLELLPADTDRLAKQVKSIPDPAELSHFVARYLGLPSKDAQALLEMTSLKNRLLRLLELLVTRREALKVQLKIRETLSESIGKKQREALLREQLKAIQDELDEGFDEAGQESYREKVEKARMPEVARKVALREVSRLERMGDQSPETHVIRNYLDLLCDMPWEVVSEKPIDLNAAEDVLNRDHFGLEKIKQRLLEHLAVMKLRPERRGSILLFVGPPGTGKTSLGKSVAEALGRQFVRVSLGGVRDDAEIRGHRRTYVGALPGRIIDGIRRAKSKDPVFVLDEIDKLAHGWTGDPASALLEVLDPEQNSAFHDHYLDVPFDLSQVFFICTANTRETIPGPLLDRMELIELSGYTTNEKFHIARRHLIPDELKAHGLTTNELEIADGALLKVIESYTREAGVRSLRREISKICRAAAARIARDPNVRVVLEPNTVGDVLGSPRFELEEVGTTRGPGVVTGMAWTPVGGDVLFVEAALVPGEGKIAVTGQLGDVMKESSQIAVALSRMKLEGVAKQVLFKDLDIHLHVPGGAIPKDGPSAGMTMFTAAASMMLDVPVRASLAMTGEVTLSGKVLPVGGIKEKVLAAARSGVTEVILPRRNERDLNDIPKEVRDSLALRLVGDVDEVIELVFGPIVAAGARALRPPTTETHEVSPTPGMSGPHLHH